MTRPLVRHFRQIVLWPVQLMPLPASEASRNHWDLLDRMGPRSPWRELQDEFCDDDPAAFQERHYKEFVTFLPYAQRFLYGSRAGQESASRQSSSSLRIYRRTDVDAVAIQLRPGAETWRMTVAHVDLCFFADADVAAVAFEMHADDLPLDVAQEILFRFGRAYPAFWENDGEGGNCPHRVEWLGADGEVLAVSDYAARTKYLDWVVRHRTPHIAQHWEFLMAPFRPEFPGETAPLRFRQLEYYRMPFLAYLAVDDPRALTRADFIRLGLVTRSGGTDELPYSQPTLEDFEAQYCDDRFWGREGANASADTRILCSGTTLAFVGAHGDRFYSGRETGLLGQFRHQYFLLFLIAHFHKAALLSMSDELAVAMNRLDIEDTASVKAFKRTIRQMMEIFLRFTHRYYFSEVSNQPLARSIFERLRRHLGIDGLYDEVRNEVVDMNAYLDSDSARRQANTVLRLTVVTVGGLVGTVATGLLGMNLLDESARPLAARIAFFVVTLAVVLVLTGLTIRHSKRLADALDILSDQRSDWREKWREFRASADGRSGHGPRRAMGGNPGTAAAGGGLSPRKTFGV
jgi:hypothetical protein